MKSKDEKETDLVLFREVQKPTRKQVHIGIIVGISILIFWYLIGSFLLMIFFLELEIFYVVARYRKLTTEVREDGVYVRFDPFNSYFKPFLFRNIQSYDVKTVDPMIYFIRGYGSKYIPRPYKYAYLTNGPKKGVLIDYVEGDKVSKLMIGSRVPEKLKGAIRKGIEQQTSL